MIPGIINKASFPFKNFWCKQIDIGHNLFFSIYLEDCIPDIQEAENSWQEGHKLTPGNDLIKNEEKAYQEEKHSQDRCTPIIKYSVFHLLRYKELMFRIIT